MLSRAQFRVEVIPPFLPWPTLPSFDPRNTLLTLVSLVAYLWGDVRQTPRSCLFSNISYPSLRAQCGVLDVINPFIPIMIRSRARWQTWNLDFWFSVKDQVCSFMSVFFHGPVPRPDNFNLSLFLCPACWWKRLCGPSKHIRRCSPQSLVVSPIISCVLGH